MSPETKGEQALKLLMQLNELDVEGYQAMIQERIDPEVLAIFESYCRQLVPPDESEEVLGTLIHLLITGYLVSANEQKPIGGGSGLIQVVD